jgi:hypothetical protein
MNYLVDFQLIFICTIVLWYKNLNQHFRKESSKKGAQIAPTTVESRDALRIEDYG